MRVYKQSQVCLDLTEEELDVIVAVEYPFSYDAVLPPVMQTTFT
jgi:hypothetical protein